MFFQKHQLKDLVIRFFFLIWNSRSGLFFVKSKNCWSVQCNTVYQIFSAAWNFCGKYPIRNLLTLSSVFSISAVKKWWKKKDCNLGFFGVLLYEIFHRLSFCLFFIGPNYSVHQEHRYKSIFFPQETIIMKVTNSSLKSTYTTWHKKIWLFILTL